jgi:hypothetical protein
LSRKIGRLSHRRNTGLSLTPERLSPSRCVQSQVCDCASTYRRSLQLVHGQAEVFGAELAENKYYLFGSECKAAVFTWQGCTIEMSLSTFCSDSPSLTTRLLL